MHDCLSVVHLFAPSPNECPSPYWMLIAVVYYSCCIVRYAVEKSFLNYPINSKVDQPGSYLGWVPVSFLGENNSWFHSRRREYRYDTITKLSLTTVCSAEASSMDVTTGKTHSHITHHNVSYWFGLIIISH